MFFKHKISIFIFIVLITVSSRSFSDTSDMQAFFDEIGAYGNAQAPSSFRGQTRNYYTGGSLSIRVPNKTFQLATFDPPRLSASCSGIDVYAGAFSFINSDQLVTMMQSIGNSAAGALFSLALEHVSPQLSAAIKFFQDQAAKINSSNINSCEAAKGIITATKDAALSGSFDNAIKGLGTAYTGVGEDWAAMKEEMQKPNDARKSVANQISSSLSATESEKMLVSGVNLIYKALSKLTRDSGGGFSDNEKRFIQAILGTIIIYPTEANGKTTMTSKYIAPTIEDPLIFLMGESDQNFSYQYRACLPFNEGGVSHDVSECVGISSTLSTATVGTSFSKIIHDKINHVRNKIDSRELLVASDYNIVNMSSLPIWSLIEDEYRTNNGLHILDNSKDLITLDYVNALLKRVLKIADKSLSTLEGLKNPGITAHIKSYREDIREIKKDIRDFHAIETRRYNVFLTSREALIKNSSRIRMMTSKRLAMAKKMIK